MTADISISNYVFFKNFSQDENRELFSVGHVMRRSPGDLLITEGRPADDLYFILSGSCQVMVTKGRHRVTIALIRKGEFLGESALFDNSSRGADVICNELTDVLYWKMSDLRQVFASYPKLGLTFYRELAHRSWLRLNETNARLRDAFQGIVQF
jgi:CRP/FNR family cyclic AMP-dependent transcriptional regulator